MENRNAKIACEKIDQEEVTHKLERFKQKYLPHYKISTEKQRNLNAFSNSKKQVVNCPERSALSPENKVFNSGMKIDTNLTFKELKPDKCLKHQDRYAQPEEEIDEQRNYLAIKRLQQKLINIDKKIEVFARKNYAYDIQNELLKLNLDEELNESSDFPKRSEVSNSVRMSCIEDESKMTESLPSYCQLSKRDQLNKDQESKRIVDSNIHYKISSIISQLKGNRQICEQEERKNQSIVICSQSFHHKKDLSYSSKSSHSPCIKQAACQREKYK